MKLIGPDVGWAATDDRLYWTATNGAAWKEITPTPALRPLPEIGPVFFLDSKSGWAFIFPYGPETGDQPKFKLAATRDGGARWTITDVTVPDLNPAVLAFPRHLTFADELHGWIELEGGHSGFAFGLLMQTSDGGRTWAPTSHDPGPPGSIELVTPSRGWLAASSGNDGDGLYVTRDGSRSWQKVSLAAPKAVAPAYIPTCDLPVFQDTRHGFEAVTYSGVEPAHSAAVLFKTDDGGSTWNPDRMLTGLEPSSKGQKVSSAFADSTWVTVKTVNPHETSPVLTKLGANARVSASSNPGSRYFTDTELSFASAAQGWLLYGAELLATCDGGATWSLISPGAYPPGSIIRWSQ